jgi:hypothetical protein
MLEKQQQKKKKEKKVHADFYSRIYTDFVWEK